GPDPDRRTTKPEASDLHEHPAHSVRERGLEPLRPKAPGPKPGVAASYTTPAQQGSYGVGSMLRDVVALDESPNGCQSGVDLGVGVPRRFAVEVDRDDRALVGIVVDLDPPVVDRFDLPSPLDSAPVVVRPHPAGRVQHRLADEGVNLD